MDNNSIKVSFCPLILVSVFGFVIVDIELKIPKSFDSLVLSYFQILILIMFKQRQPASSKGSVVVTVEGSQLGRPLLKDNGTPWSKVVLDLYPPGTSVR